MSKRTIQNAVVRGRSRRQRFLGRGRGYFSGTARQPRHIRHRDHRLDQCHRIGRRCCWHRRSAAAGCFASTTARKSISATHGVVEPWITAIITRRTGVPNAVNSLTRPAIHLVGPRGPVGAPERTGAAGTGSARSAVPSLPAAGYCLPRWPLDRERQQVSVHALVPGRKQA